MFRQDEPSIGARRTRLNTAKDEKISSRSIIFQSAGYLQRTVD